MTVHYDWHLLSQGYYTIKGLQITCDLYTARDILNCILCHLTNKISRRVGNCHRTNSITTCNVQCSAQNAMQSTVEYSVHCTYCAMYGAMYIHTMHCVVE